MVQFSSDAEVRLAEIRLKEEEDLAGVLSQKYGLTYADLTKLSVSNEAMRLVSESEAKAAEMAVFARANKKLSIALRAPNNPRARAVIDTLKNRGYSVDEFIVSRRSLEHAWLRYADISHATETKRGAIDVSNEDLTTLIASIKDMAGVKSEITKVTELDKAHRISRIVEVVLAGALALKASDVHIEPEEHDTRLRYRLDGVLAEVAVFDHDTYRLLLSRIKLLSGLKLNITNEAQDGRFSVNIKDRDIEIRSSILPGNYGESIVMRLLDPQSIEMTLEDLGLPKNLETKLLAEIEKPNGMILTTGPTGSGKTTLLYALMRKVHTPEIKIITIEDPIEYHVDGIVQTQVSKNYSFGVALRSILRQDPDVIMVGEIRDRDVVETAINAALTGHLVFSTLHTNNAAGAFPRLIDLGANTDVFNSALNIVMAQRLARRLCDNCKKETPLTQEEQALVDTVLTNLSNPQLAPKNRSKAYAAVGCDDCTGTGYKSRIGIYEAIIMDKAVAEALRNYPSERDIRAAAKPQGILTLREDAIVKVLNGVTSFEEIRRVVDLDEDS